VSSYCYIASVFILLHIRRRHIRRKQQGGAPRQVYRMFYYQPEIFYYQPEIYTRYADTEQQGATGAWHRTQTRQLQIFYYQPEIFYFQPEIFYH